MNRETVSDLLNAIDRFNEALDGASGDEESDAACEMRDSAMAVLGEAVAGDASLEALVLHFEEAVVSVLSQ